MESTGIVLSYTRGYFLGAIPFRLSHKQAILSIAVIFLLPFDRCRRFAADVVYHPIDALYFVDNPCGNASKQFVG